MTNEKYEFTGEAICENGVRLQRIRALRDIHNPSGFVHAGDLGGWIESTKNLSHTGDAWVFDDGCVYGRAVIANSASIHNSAEVAGDGWDSDSDAFTFVLGNAQIREYALVSQNATVEEHAIIRNYATVSGSARVDGFAIINSKACVRGRAHVTGHSLFGGIATWGILYDVVQQKSLNLRQYAMSYIRYFRAVIRDNVKALLCRRWEEVMSMNQIMNDELNKVFDSFKDMEKQYRNNKEFVLATIRSKMMLDMMPLNVRRFVEKTEDDTLWELYESRRNTHE